VLKVVKTVDFYSLGQRFKSEQPIYPNWDHLEFLVCPPEYKGS